MQRKFFGHNVIKLEINNRRYMENPKCLEIKHTFKQLLGPKIKSKGKLEKNFQFHEIENMSNISTSALPRRT